MPEVDGQHSGRGGGLAPRGLPVIRQSGYRRAENRSAQRSEASPTDRGEVMGIQRFGSAAVIKVHRHGPMLDGVYRFTGGAPVCMQARAPGAIHKPHLLGLAISGGASDC